MYTTRTTCRVCGSDNLTELFSLGEQYVSDFVDQQHRLGENTTGVFFDLDDPNQWGKKCPIVLQLCGDCTLVQSKHTAPQDFLYTRHYWYRSGVTQSMRDALGDIAQSVSKTIDLVPGDIVLDIGSNDGTLLSYYPEELVTVGVEPATNLAKEGKEWADFFVPDFWTYENYGEYVADGEGDPPYAKVITAIGMFYDLEDPNQFIADVAKALHPEGIFVAQLMCLKQTIEMGDVGNLAHEHLEFYSLASLRHLFNKHNLEIFRVEENSVNGGSYRIYARHPSGDKLDESVMEHMLVEEGMGLNHLETYNFWVVNVRRNANECYSFIKGKVDEGFKVWVYGASTKGNVILQYYGLDNTLIAGAADRSPEKWGKYTVGTGIKIYLEEEARLAHPDFFLVLPYAFLGEFMEREKEWREGGGQFIVPLPEFKIV